MESKHEPSGPLRRELDFFGVPDEWVEGRGLHDKLRRMGPNDLDATVESFVALCTLARVGGLLEAENHLSHVGDQTAATLIQLVTDGVEPADVMRVADNQAAALKRRMDTYLEILRQGIDLYQRGQNPRLVAEQLYALLGKTPSFRSPVDLAESAPCVPLSDFMRVTNDELVRFLGDLGLAEMEQNQCRTFAERLLGLDDCGLQKVMRHTDSRELVLALKVAPRELRERVLNNMSSNAGQMIVSDDKYLGPCRLKDVEDAQARILATVASLVKRGEIAAND